MALCDICDTEPQVVAFGMLDTGDWKYLCPGCFSRAALDIIKLLLPAEEIAASLGPMFVAPQAKETNKEAGKKGRKAQAETTPPETPPAGEAGGPDEVPAAAQDK